MEEEKLAIGNRKLRINGWLQFLIVVAGIILAMSASSFLRLRYDLTGDKRFTLSQPTRKVLSHLKNDVFIQVYLDGEIPIPLKRLKRSVSEMLDEFRIASGRKVDFEFINPSAGKDAKQRDALYETLSGKGLSPIRLQASDAEGGSTNKIIFPGMIVNYNGVEVPVNFLNNSTVSYEQNILRSVEGLEYEMIQTIATLTSDSINKVAFIEGQDEIPEVETADITMSLARFFTIDRGTIAGKKGILDKYSAIVIAGPEKAFNESDKLVLDQYIMNGGRVLWLIDEVKVNADSLAFGETVGLFRPLNIEDQLFRYGARINPGIVQDLECATIRLMVMSGGTRKEVVSLPWVYNPLLRPSSNHPVTRNLNRVIGKFADYIDTVGLDPAIRKKILLSSSELSRVISPPAYITLKEAEQTPSQNDFNKKNLPVAVLLEGKFPSAFNNRVVSNLTEDKNFKLKTESKDTRMIVIADADIIRNEIEHSGTNVSPLPLGRDKYTGEIFGNSDFLINCLNWLVDKNGLMELRSRELKLRLLNKQLLKTDRVKWQIINIAGPLTIVVLAGLLFSFLRRKKYTAYS
jgi:gliding-associated putative ABC transporter substrate-binding component GldG